MANSVIGRLAVILGLDSTAFEQGSSKAQKQANQLGREIQKSFTEAGKSCDSIVGPLTQLGGQFSGTMGMIGAQISGVVRAAGSMGTGFGVAGVAAVGAAAGVAVLGAAVTTLAISGAETVEQIEHLSQKTGIARDELVAWGAVAKANGTNLETFELGVKRLEVAMSGMTPQGKVARQVLADLGITAKDPQRALLELADAFEKMPDGAKKAAAAVAIFGRSGTDMIPLLDRGREEIEKWETTARAMGPDITDGAVKATEDWKEATTKLSLAWDKVKVSMSWILAVPTGVLSALAAAANSLSNVKLGMASPLGGLSIGFGGDASKKFDTDKIFKNLGQKNQEQNDREQLESAQQLFELAKARGPAEAKLAETQKLITEDLKAGTLERIKDATALERQLPALQKAAELEKQRRSEMEQRAELRKYEMAHIGDAIRPMFSKEMYSKQAKGGQSPLDEANEMAKGFGTPTNFPDFQGGEVQIQGGPDSFKQAWANTFADLIRDGNNFSSNIMESIGGAIQHLNKELADFIMTGKGLNVTKLFQTLGSQVIQSALLKGESSLFSALGLGVGAKKPTGTMGDPIWVVSTAPPLATPGGGGGFLSKLFGGLQFGGGFADGGFTTPGRSYLIGEQGPEMFTPGVSGAVTPMRTGPVYNIDARGADAGAELRIRMALRDTEERAVARAVGTVDELRKRR